MRTQNPNPEEAVEQIVTQLSAEGWKEYPDYFNKHSRSLFKRFDTQTPCACNNEQHGIQIQISISNLNGWIAMDLNLSGELKDGTWIQLNNYGLPDSVSDVLRLVPRMLEAWESYNTETEDSAWVSLQTAAEHIAGHIEKPYTVGEITEILASGEYSAELMLQHLLLLCVKTKNESE